MSSFFNFDKIKKKFPFLHDSHNNSGGGGGGSFLSPFTKSGGSVNSARSKKHGHNLIVDKDPEQIWDLVGELGDGAFGKVHKARNKQSSVLAAAKIVDKCTEEELDEYMIEIDILSECRHKNIVQIYEAYHYNSKLWKNLKSNSPCLTHPNMWSVEFSEFLEKCLAKDPNQRLNARQLLNQPFVENCEANEESIKRLIKEARLKIDSRRSSSVSRTLYTESPLYSSQSVVQTIDEQIDINITSSKPIENNLAVSDSCLEWIFDSICDDVLRSDYEIPSIPHVIFEVINEL